MRLMQERVEGLADPIDPGFGFDLIRLDVPVIQELAAAQIGLGILVALIKIAQLATVHAGIGMYAVGALILLFPAIVVTFDVRELWRRVEWDHDDAFMAAAGSASTADSQA